MEKLIATLKSVLTGVKLIAMLKSVMPGFETGGRRGSWRLWINAAVPMLVMVSAVLLKQPDLLEQLGLMAGTITVIMAVANLVTMIKDHWMTLGSTGVTSWRLWINLAAIILTTGQAYLVDLHVPQELIAQATVYANLFTMVKDHWGGKVVSA